MLTDEQKKAIEIYAAESIRRSWGGLNGTRVRGMIDDVRSKVIEEGWFGKSVTGELNDPRYVGHLREGNDIRSLYESGVQKLENAFEAVFGAGEQARADATRQNEITPPEHGRDGPEAGG